MLQTLKSFWNPQRAKQLGDVRNIALYIFGIVVLAITWSGIKTVQNNYQLQKQISVLKQQNEVLKLENQNIELESRYLQTDQYLEFSARQDLGLAAPGEKVLLVPKSTAMKYVDPSLSQPAGASGTSVNDQRPAYLKNLEDWRDFLLGRKLFD